MNPNEDSDAEEHWFSRFENECLESLDRQDGDGSSRVQSMEEHTAQQLWLGFQQTSTSIAQLYNCKESSSDSYVVLGPFNKSAESLTKFYKDSVNSARESLRLGLQVGRSSRARELAAWARKKRKHIRRDELLAHLCGRPLPPHRQRPPRGHDHRAIGHDRAIGHERSLGHLFPPHPPADSRDAGDFSVRESFSLQGLNGAMANFGFPGRSSSPSSPSSPPREDHHFLEDREHRKRANSSSSSMDVSMDSPSRKKGRFL